MAEGDCKIEVRLGLTVDQLRVAFENMGRAMQEVAASATRGMAEVMKAMSKTDINLIAAAIRKAELAAEQSADDEAGFMSRRVIRVRGCTKMQSLAGQVHCADCDWARVWDGSPRLKCRRFGFKCDTQRPARKPGHQTLCAVFIPRRVRSCLNCGFFRHDPEQYSPEQGFCDLPTVLPFLAPREGFTTWAASIVKPLMPPEQTDPCTHWRPKPPQVCSSCRHADQNGAGWWVCQKIQTPDGLPLMTVDLQGMHCEKEYEPNLQAIARREFQGVESWQMSWFDLMEITPMSEYEDDVPF